MPPKAAKGSKPAGKAASKSTASKPAASKQSHTKTQEGAAKEETPPAPPTKIIGVRQLADVVLDVISGDIKYSGLYPLIIDSTSAANTFLRYREANYLNAQNPGDMEVRAIRLALVGGLRYGKPVVLDLADTNLVNIVREKFDAVLTGLLELIISKDITKEEVYKSLVTAEDDPAYSSWLEYRADNFIVIVLAANDTACLDIKHRVYNVIVG